MKKNCLSIGFMLLFSVCCFGQTTERIIDFTPKQIEGNLIKGENGMLVPTDLKSVELVGVSIEGNDIELGKPFSADDDWLKTLKVKLKNVSDKPISSVRISIAQPEAKYKDGTLSFSLAFGSLSPMAESRQINKIIQPGEEFELSQSEKEYNGGQLFIVQRAGVVNTARIIIGMTMVRFEDGNVIATMKLSKAK